MIVNTTNSLRRYFLSISCPKLPSCNHFALSSGNAPSIHSPRWFRSRKIPSISALQAPGMFTSSIALARLTMMSRRTLHVHLGWPAASHAARAARWACLLADDWLNRDPW